MNTRQASMERIHAEYVRDLCEQQGRTIPDWAVRLTSF